MKNIILVLAMALLLVGCGKPVDEWTTTAAKEIPGMPGCTYQRVYTGLAILRVVRCNNQTVTTTYQEGKTDASVIVDSH